MRHHARAIFDAALAAVDAEAAVIRALQALRLDADRVVVIGVGKAAAAMARGAERVLGDRIVGGHVTVKDGHGLPLQTIRVVEAGHPVPDARSVRAADEALALAQGCGPGDLVVFMISGGGSSLWTAPAAGLSLADLAETTRVLVDSGIDIQQINQVRRALSRIKGGRLAQAAWPARAITLIVSDVLGGPHVVASGPTVADPSTRSDARAVIDASGLRDRLPAAVLACLERDDARGSPLAEGPVRVVADHRAAVHAAAAEATRRGFDARVLAEGLDGDTLDAARAHLAALDGLVGPACLVSGGETTVRVVDGGLGGRNQHFALACALGIDGRDDVVVLSGGTDGTDGPTDAAGGLVDGATVARARAAGLDAAEHLRRFDAHPLLAATGDLLVTGPTRTNVMDVRLVLVGADPR